MQANPDDYMPFVPGPYQGYLAYMATDRTYGTQAEIMALSNGLGRPVRVWQADPKVSRGSPLACRIHAKTRSGNTIRRKVFMFSQVHQLLP